VSTPDVLFGFTIGFTIGAGFGVVLSAVFAWKVLAALVKFGRKLRERRDSAAR
jgi:hypothetical protein